MVHIYIYVSQFHSDRMGEDPRGSPLVVALLEQAPLVGFGLRDV